MKGTESNNSPFFKHITSNSEGIPKEVLKVVEIYEAVRQLDLPAPLRKPIRTRGRKSYNRFLIIALILYGLKREWSFRQIQEFARENWGYLSPLSFNIKKEPDHSTIYLVASKLRVLDVFRYFAKLKEMRGEIRVLWY
ncbi:hypothetical protein [Geoglobus acetivorans]|uniref:Transposase InsH N-terminal domain-containing protein n=1 Tax=Geoglobus acetivorans TaxID=565033 RepID=A0A0A7GGX4_GEOAI|nr:hypothetical protein GACE_1160 [Geoglobus acetivorans]